MRRTLPVSQPSATLPLVSTAVSEGLIWDRVIRAEEGSVPPDVARFLLELDFPEDDLNRLEDLNTRANEGLLTASEREELAHYIHVGDVLSLLQSKARRSLARRG